MVALTFAANAQSPPPLLQIVQVEVKPDRVAEWREITKRFSEAHKKAGGAWRHVWWNRIGNPLEYAIVFPRENYAEYDSPGPARRGMSEAERAGLIARRRQCTDSVRVTIRRPIPELAIGGGGQPPKRLRTITTRVRVGMANEYISHLEELVAAYKKAGMPAYGVHRIRYGGSRRTFLSWYPIDKMAELDGPGWLSKSMSEDARSQWIEKLLPLIEHSEFKIWTYQSELSYHPEE